MYNAQILLACNGKEINQLTEYAKKHYKKGNPIDFILPVGSIINYNADKKLTRYKILAYEAITVASSNYTYKNQLIVHVEEV